MNATEIAREINEKGATGLQTDHEGHLQLMDHDGCVIKTLYDTQILSDGLHRMPAATEQKPIEGVFVVTGTFGPQLIMYGVFSTREKANYVVDHLNSTKTLPEFSKLPLDTIIPHQKKLKDGRFSSLYNSNIIIGGYNGYNL